MFVYNGTAPWAQASLQRDKRFSGNAHGRLQPSVTWLPSTTTVVHAAPRAQCHRCLHWGRQTAEAPSARHWFPPFQDPQTSRHGHSTAAITACLAEPSAGRPLCCGQSVAQPWWGHPWETAARLAHRATAVRHCALGRTTGRQTARSPRGAVPWPGMVHRSRVLEPQVCPGA